MVAGRRGGPRGAGRVWSSPIPAALDRLNGITHGPLAASGRPTAGRTGARRASIALAVLEAAVYFLLPSPPPVDLVIAVDAPTGSPRARAWSAQRAWTPQAAAGRIAAQATMDRTVAPGRRDRRQRRRPRPIWHAPRIDLLAPIWIRPATTPDEVREDVTVKETLDRIDDALRAPGRPSRRVFDYPGLQTELSKLESQAGRPGILERPGRGQPGPAQGPVPQAVDRAPGRGRGPGRGAAAAGRDGRRGRGRRDRAPKWRAGVGRAGQGHREARLPVPAQRRGRRARRRPGDPSRRRRHREPGLGPDAAAHVHPLLRAQRA